MKNQRLIAIFKTYMLVFLTLGVLPLVAQPVFTDNVTDSLTITYPSIGASSPNYVYINPTSLTFKWTSGNGLGRIVLASTDSTTNAWPGNSLCGIWG